MILKISCAKFGQDQPKPVWFFPFLDPPLKNNKTILGHYVHNEKYIYTPTFMVIGQTVSKSINVKQTNIQIYIYYYYYYLFIYLHN